MLNYFLNTIVRILVINRLLIFMCAMDTLLDLPNEILLLIVSYLGTVKNLVALSKTCKRFNYLLPSALTQHDSKFFEQIKMDLNTMRYSDTLAAYSSINLVLLNVHTYTLAYNDFPTISPSSLRIILFPSCFASDYGKIISTIKPLSLDLSFHGEESTEFDLDTLRDTFGCTLLDVPWIKTLDAFKHMEVVHLDGCLKIKDISALKEARCVTLEDFPLLTDISALSNAKYVKLKHCHALDDVSALRNVPEIHLHNCAKIHDVSMFGKCRVLDIRECYLVDDVSALGGVDTLSIENCNRVHDVGALHSVRVLSLYGCDLVTDVSMLGRVYSLNLSSTGVIDVSALGGVHTLDLSHTKVMDVSVLGNVYDLDLSYTCVVDVSALKNVHTLDLASTDVVDVSGLRHVRSLDLTCCEKISDITPLREMELDYLSILGCINIIDMRGVHAKHIDVELHRILYL